MKILVALVVCGALCFSLVTSASAGEPKDKLARGATNVLSAVLEIPQNIDTEWKESKNAGIGIVVGLFKGLFWGVARGASGVWDIVTCPIPNPENYGSVIQPEYVKRGVQTHFLSDEQKVKK
ncbi:MAG TPA: exosortase system-associated protein, TIGR04073 family [Candidatus Omnitrophota bacterium]|nr:exosortase system-associated protein, TIGR04073 family [Candidatus Omnitrophota bacterium]HPD85499.1 exosortase system-associated protein, TIGR04073 family [Candidatus Omnitrophota bacterium]HRZ04000.1 exosortase system-associated protein, TIGR04073 family [Candidatus Omnitrophota bacterium]